MKKSILIFTLLFVNIISNSQSWTQIEKIVASDRDAGDYFGQSVSISGDYAVIGSPYENHDTAGNNWISEAGSAYIYEKNSSGSWIQVQKIVASDRATDDRFGWQVSISGDYIIVGTLAEDENEIGGNTMIDAGSAYIFKRNSLGIWNQTQKIVASDRASNDQFGRSVSISANTIIVGAQSEDHDVNGLNYMYSSGSVYVFELDSSGIWSQTQKIVASDRASYASFGWSVSIFNHTIVVGAQGAKRNVAGTSTSSMIDAGAAYFFEKNSTGAWTQTQKVVASDRYPGDIFGYSVSLSNNYAVISAVGEDHDLNGLNQLSLSGSAYIFKRDSLGNWNETQKIIASDRASGDQFGKSVSISGNTIIVGSRRESEDTAGLYTITSAGSAYIFKIDSTGNWSESQKIVAQDRGLGDEFGISVSISGNTIVVGSYLEDEDLSGGNTLLNPGSAYIFSNILCSDSYDTLQINACNSYLWPQNSVIYNTTGIYYDTLSNQAGCDSLISLDLSIYYSSSSNISTTSCGDYYWVQTGFIYNSSGTYSDTITNPAGCDSIITLNLIVSPKPTVTSQPVNRTIGVGNNVQFNVIASGSLLNYKWQQNNGTGFINLSNFGIFSGVNTDTLKISGVNSSLHQNGYRCILADSNSCQDTSQVGLLFVETTGFDEKEINKEFVIYPNPTQSILNINTDILYSNIEIINTLGQVVFESGEINEINLSNFRAGIYFIYLKNKKGNILKVNKFIKKTK